MKKRMSKAARETLEEMAKSQCCSAYPSCNHPEKGSWKLGDKPHNHDRKFCDTCMMIFMQGFSDCAATEKMPEKEIVYRTSWVHWIVLLLWGLTLSGWLGTARYYLNHPIDKPYPIYRTVYVPTPNPLCETKLADCQADYRAQRAAIKYLTKKQKEMELP